MMLVETYEAIEQDEQGAYEDRTEAQALVEQLGLDGQSRFVCPDGGDGVPYRKMTKLEYQVYSALLGERTELHKYSDGPIPLRVLQVAAHAQNLDFFERLMVWHPESADIKDPLLIGERMNGTTREMFMLARWGEELKSMGELTTLAAERLRMRITAKLKSAQAEIEHGLRRVDTITDGELIMMEDYKRNPTANVYL